MDSLVEEIKVRSSFGRRITELEANAYEKLEKEDFQARTTPINIATRIGGFEVMKLLVNALSRFRLK